MGKAIGPAPGLMFSMLSLRYLRSSYHPTSSRARDQLEELKEMISSGGLGGGRTWRRNRQDPRALEDLISDAIRPATKSHAHPTKARVAEALRAPGSRSQRANRDRRW